MKDFACFILSHGRAGNVKTLSALKRQGYTGKWVIVIDDEDDQADAYREAYGEEHVAQFCKQEVYDKTDTGDIFNIRQVILYARNFCDELARSLGIKYYLVLDDDYSEFSRRTEKNKVLLSQKVNADALFSAALKFYRLNPQITTMALAQGGDFIGGCNSGTWRAGYKRKAMNTFFCSTERPLKFIGSINEDVNSYSTLQRRGMLFLTCAFACTVQTETQSNAEGMTPVYKKYGTYLKSFYSVMFCPSACKVQPMGEHKRIHHVVNFNACAPCIISDRFKKNA